MGRARGRTRSAPPGVGARRATSTPPAPRASSAPDGRTGGVVRVERLPRAHPAPGGRRRRARRARPLGRGLRVGPAHRRVPADPLRARARARRVEARRGAPCCSRPGSPRTSACSRRSADPASLVLLRRAQPRVDHRRLPPRARRRRGVPPRRPRARRRAALRLRRRGAAIVVTDTVFSMDGDVAPVDDLVDVCARHGALLVLDEAHAVLGPDPDLGDVDAVRVGTLSKTLGALGGFVAGPRALHRPPREPRLAPTSSRPRRRRPTAAAALAALAIVRSAEGDELRAPAACARRPRAARPPVADRARRARRRARHARGGRVAARRRDARAGDPAAHRSGRARRDCGCAVGRAHRRAGRHARRRARRGHLDGSDATRPRRLVVVTGTGTEVGKTWVAAAPRVRAHRARARRRGAQAGAVVRERRRRDRRRRARRRDRRRPARGVPARPLVRGRDGTADGRRGSRPAGVHRSPISRPSCTGPTASTSAWSRARAGPALRSRPTATPSTCAPRFDPTLVVLVADAGLGTINAVRLAHAPLAEIAPGHRGAEPLRRRRRPPRAQPRVADRPRRARRHRERRGARRARVLAPRSSRR